MPDVVTRLNAALEGRYRIEREIGEGGMATVYLARDLRHNRNVALKVLKPELAAVVGGERFLAEIETTANLQHPHILPLYDSGEADNFLFFVMPFVEGETLRDRLDREKQFPVEEAVRIATAVANALAYAHEHGVIHRDIKPGNIMLQAGQPVVGDFGIAIAVGAAGGARLTETGLSVGTPFYMSPEQATGDVIVGPASDIYALGAVLYELLTGEPPYTGTTAQAVLGRIIQGAPVSATAIRRSVPANVDAAIRKSLERLPADRFASAGEFVRALADPSFRHGEGEGTALVSRRTRAAAWAGWGAAAAFALAFGWSALRPAPPLPVERFNVELPPQGDPALAPDGSAMVVDAPTEGGGEQLLLRRWGDLEATPIAGTAGTEIFTPAFSPDGSEVAYVQGGQLKVAPLAGGVVRVLSDSAGWGPRWGADGYIYYSGARDIRRTPSGGGETDVLISAADGEQVYDLQLLPGGEVGVFVTFSTEGTRLEGLRLSTGERSVLTEGLKAYPTPDGYLVFGTVEGRILAAPFDPETMELTAAPVPLVEGAFVDLASNYATFAVSESGTLVYLAGPTSAGVSELVWITRGGEVSPVDPAYTFRLGTNYGIRLSPDGGDVALNTLLEGNEDIRVKHLPDGAEERISFSEDMDVRPLWSPDGQSLTWFGGPGADDLNVWTARANGTGTPSVLLDDDRTFSHGSWSPDGSVLVLRAAATAAMGLGFRDILAFRPESDTAAAPLVASSEFAENSPELSPDGRWLAYSSNETGRDEVFIRPFPEVEADRIRVSTSGGGAPIWARSGRELFYVGQGRELVAAAFDPAAGRVTSQEALFPIPPGYVTSVAQDFYDVSPDGQRFLMARPYEDESQGRGEPRWVVVRNWMEEVRARVPR